MPSASGPKNILFATSTLPSYDKDPVPAFIKDELIWLKKTYPDVTLSVLAPHSSYSHTKSFVRQSHYDEYRFHYFWPFRFERLAGRGIQPALKKNKLLYLELPGLFIFEFFATWRLVRKIKPDLIVSCWFTPQAITGAMVSKLTGVPFVFDTQASDVIVLKKIPFAKKIVGAICDHARSYTAPSQQTADKLLYFTTPANRKRIISKLYKIPLGTKVPSVDISAVKKIQKKYGLDNKRVIYFIGRLVDRKGIDILIKAFEPMSKRDLSLRLVIAGDGQDRQSLEALVQQLGLAKSVLFTGYLTGSQKYGMLKLADTCVIPSINVGDHAEGLPVVFMEGVSYGKVMVISDATGAHETAVDGQNAFIAKAGSVEDLRQKMYEALAVNKADNPDFYNAVKKLSRKFQWPTIIKQRYETFKQ